MTDHFLHRYFLSNGGKGLHKWMHYFDIYEQHLERFRGTCPVVIEIGVSGGGSLQMWRDYFGPGARIVGIDIEPKCKRHETDGVEIFIGSQDDPALIAAIVDKYGPIDIVIDDGSHRSQHMIASFELLYGGMSPRGVYLVEDCYLCYRAAYGAGLKSPDSFIEAAKDRVDQLNAAHNELAVTGFTRSTRSICFYDSIVVFERAPQGMRQHPATGAMSPRRPVHVSTRPEVPERKARKRPKSDDA